jgi:hypothetical protein
MANPSIRGHQGQFKIFKDGELQNIVNITNVEVNQDSDFSKSEYVGNPVPEGDQSIKGWSGSLEAEVKDASIDEFIDALTTANLAGIGVSDYTFIVTESYANGVSKSYAYFDCQFKMSRRQSGLSEKITKRLEFQAAGRVPL